MATTCNIYTRFGKSMLLTLDDFTPGDLVRFKKGTYWYNRTTKVLPKGYGNYTYKVVKIDGEFVYIEPIGRYMWGYDGGGFYPGELDKL